jgi:GT2 family glycosyltransferase
MCSLRGVAAAVSRSYRYGGVRELLGCCFCFGKSLLLPLYAHTCRASIPLRYWPTFSPELLAIREYRTGIWFAFDIATSVARQIKTLGELCDCALDTKVKLVRLHSPEGDALIPKYATESAIVVCGNDHEVLRNYFCSIYENTEIKIGASKWAGENDFLIMPPTASKRKVSVVIPTRDKVALLRVAVGAVLQYGGCANPEIIVVDNGSKDTETASYLRSLSEDKTVLVIRDDKPFNWSRLNNIAARQSSGEVLVFLNNDVQAIEYGWLERLAAFTLMSGVGCVGPMLLYPDNFIQHAGVVIGMGRWADHLYKFDSPDTTFEMTSFVPPALTRPVLGLTGACLAISKQKFEQLGGFDEAFQIVFSDVELCVRAHKHGLRNLYLGEVRLYHYESKSRDPRDVPDSDFHRARTTLEPFRTSRCDPFFHPRLSKLSLSPKSDLLFTSLSKWIRS